jgi:hypothetical protein
MAAVHHAFPVHFLTAPSAPGVAEAGFRPSAVGAAG